MVGFLPSPLAVERVRLRGYKKAAICLHIPSAGGASLWSRPLPPRERAVASFG